MGFPLGKIFIHDTHMLPATHIGMQRTHIKPEITQMKEQKCIL